MGFTAKTNSSFDKEYIHSEHPAFVVTLHPVPQLFPDSAFGSDLPTIFLPLPRSHGSFHFKRDSLSQLHVI